MRINRRELLKNAGLASGALQLGQVAASAGYLVRT